MPYPQIRPTFSFVSAIVISMTMFLLLFFVQLVGIYAFTPLRYPLALDMATRFNIGGADGVIVAASTIFAAIILAMCVGLIAWLSHGSFAKAVYFLGLKKSNHKKTTINAVILLIACNIIDMVLGKYLQKDPMLFMQTLITKDSLLLMMVAVVMAAPIYEELIFRGLIFGIWADTLQKYRHGTAIAGVIAGVLFAGIHLQYDGYGMALIFLLALVFAYARIKGSLWLAMGLHFLNNLMAMAVFLWGRSL